MGKCLLLSLLIGLMGGCAASTVNGDYEITKADPAKGDSSAEAVFVNFAFDGELYSSSVWNTEQAIEDQLLYTIGHLNGDRAVGRLDRLQLSDVQTSQVDGLTRVRYHAVLPVAWGRNTAPSAYTFELPRRADSTGYEAFTSRYSHDCVDAGAHDVDSGSMWYYFRPSAYRCQLRAEDIVTSEVTVTPSASQTTGRFPEYNMVWADNALRVVAIFGKYEDGATSGDSGITGYQRFATAVASALRSYRPTTVPARIPSSPSVSTPDLQWNANLPNGKRVEIVALLVDNVRTTTTAFNTRYETLSSTADLIVYNGHAGLGANVRALARKGRWVAGQYAIVFMNGCDTFAYIDNALWEAHGAVNPNDPTGTKYMDIVTNAMPSYFSSMPNATMALVNGLLNHSQPRTYEQIFASIDSQQVVLVSGEEDNTYQPGGGGDPTMNQWVLRESGTVRRNQEVRFTSPTLPAGKYRVQMSGSNDADLHVRIGSAPTDRLYDCRPYAASSNETCTVDLAAPAAVHIMVRGFSSSSTFQLSGGRQ